LIKHATPKLVCVVLLASLALVLGFVTGRPELVALCACLALPQVISLSAGPLPEVQARLEFDPSRSLEGDTVTATATLTADGPSCEVEIGLGLPPELSPRGRARRAFILPAGETVIRKFPLRAERWGAHKLGPLAVRVRHFGGLVTGEELFGPIARLKVYPTFEQVMRAIPPPDTKSYSGDYAARASGDGIEFASVRDFIRGDSPRRINWRATSRQGFLHVNVAHPERDADIVLFLDTFYDADLSSRSTLDLTVRGAAALARHHLRHNDRVGLISFGGTLRWLTASMGRTHAYRIADFLLDVSASFSYAWKNIDILPQATLPPSAFVIAFSPLIDRRALGAITDIAARGFSVVVIDTLTEDEIAPGGSPEETLAYRVWRLQRDMVRGRLESAGVPVVKWAGETSIESALAQVPRRRSTTSITL
jgi:uncharacterized protein (DUF58 family)